MTVEVMMKMDWSLSLAIFATGGGISPLLYAGNDAQQKILITFSEVSSRGGRAIGSTGTV
jgi:hypothetical protein